MGLLSCLLRSCLLGNCPSKWLTNREKLRIFMRFFLLMLAFVQKHNKQDWCNFYQEMYSFVNLSKEYLSNYDGLTKAREETYQRRLHEILKLMCHNHTYVIGGTWGNSWSLSQLYAFYQAVLSEVKQDPYPGVIGIGKRYDLPGFSCSKSSDPFIRQKIERELFGVLFDLPREMCQAFPVIFKSESPSQPLNVPPHVVSKPFVDPSAGRTHLAKMSKSLAIAKSMETPRRTQLETPKADLTPVPTPRSYSSQPSTPRAPCTPRTPRLPNFSDWLLFKLLSPEFLQFLQQQSQQSSSDQLNQMFGVLRMFFTQYGFELLYHHNRNTIYSFFQALDAYPVVKTALKLYRGKPLDGWMDIRIVSQSNEEDQKRFYEYLKMIIHLKVWLCDDAEKKEFSAECDGKLWVFCDETDALQVHDLPEPELPEPAIHLEQSGIA